ncbi:MAG: hypothetical protein SPJ90_10995 [Prevotella sp.]|nr:hypothetical protein [Prevotellaceae bacterium]MDY5844924.1 hypothetical protein [Prevotella sp.]
MTCRHDNKDGWHRRTYPAKRNAYYIYGTFLSYQFVRPTLFPFE